MTKIIKRFASLTLALAMVVSLGALAFAAPSVSAVENGVFVTSLSYADDTYQPGAVVDYISQDFSPGDTIEIFLDPAKFVGTDLEFTPEHGMSTRDLENAGIQLRTSGGKNSNLIQNVSFNEKTLNEKPVAYIQVKLISNFTETTSRDFETTISLYANKHKAQSITVGGTLSNESYQVDANEDYIFLGDGTVVTATENVPRIEIDTGNQVSIFARLLKDRQYYAVSSLTPSNADAELLGTYEELELVINLSTRGFDPATTPQIKIGSDETLYVYNAEGKYLGTTKDLVDLSEKYYLANEKVDFVSSDETSSGSDSQGDGSNAPADEGELPQGDGSGAPQVDTDPPGSVQVGGGDSDIPDTGINTGFKVAIAAGVLAIILIPILIFTSKKDDDSEE